MYSAKVCHMMDNGHPLSSVNAFFCFVNFHICTLQRENHRLAFIDQLTDFSVEAIFCNIFPPVSDSYLRRAENDTLMAVVQHSSSAASYQSWYGIVWFGIIVWFGMVCYGMGWYGVVLYGVVLHGMACYQSWPSERRNMGI